MLDTMLEEAARLLNNRAAAHLAMQQPEPAYRDAQAVLSINPANKKALHRSTMACKDINTDLTVPQFLIKRVFRCIVSTEALDPEAAAALADTLQTESESETESNETDEPTAVCAVDRLRERGNELYRSSLKVGKFKDLVKLGSEAVRCYTAALALVAFCDEVRDYAFKTTDDAVAALKAQEGEKLGEVFKKLTRARDIAILKHIVRKEDDEGEKTVVLLERLRLVMDRITNRDNEFWENTRTNGEAPVRGDAVQSAFDDIPQLASVRDVVPVGAESFDGASALHFCKKALENGRVERCRLPHTVVPIFTCDNLSAETMRPDIIHSRLGKLTEARVQWFVRSEMNTVDAAYVNVPGDLNAGGIGGVMQTIPLSPPEYDVRLRAGVHVIHCHDIGVLGHADTSEMEPGEVSQVVLVNDDPKLAAALRILWRVAVRDEPAMLLEMLYSTTWSPATMKVFGEEVEAELQSDCAYELEGYGTGDDRVLKTLKVWSEVAKRPDSLEKARDFHFRRIQAAQPMIGTDASSCWMFARESDKVAVAKYELSGDFPPMEPGEERVASVFAIDDGLQSVLGAVRIDAVAENLHDGENIIDAHVRALLAKCERICALRKQLIVAVWAGQVRDIADKLKEQCPQSVVWGCIDGYGIDEFHALARAVSGFHTLHVGYSARWTQATMGAALADCIRYEKPAETAKTILKLTDYMHNVQLSTVGLENVMTSPLRESPLVSTGPYLQLKFGRAFAEHFAEAARKNGEHFSARLMPPLVVLPVLPTNRNLLRMTWTYSEQVKLVAEDDNSLL